MEQMETAGKEAEIKTVTAMGSEADSIVVLHPDEFNVNAYDLYAYVEEDIELKDSHFSIGVSTSADGMGAFMNGTDPGRIFSNRIYASNMTQSRMGGGIFSDSDSSNSPNTPEPTPVEVFDHKIPLRYSLKVSFPLFTNLTLDTGIAYSYLKSDIRYGDTYNGVWKGEQKLHFLGVPVGVRYTPMSLNNFDCYIAGGAMAEKCIAGTIINDTQGKPYSYPGCEERPWQFSLNAGVGVQYNLAKECGIYLEPGMSIYIKNGSRLRSIYNERPINFNLNIGIRFSPNR